MRKLLLNALMCLTVSAAAISFAPLASAQDFELEIGRDGPRMRLSDDRCDPRFEPCRDYRGRDRDYRGRESMRHDEFRRGCTEGRALDKAQRMGLRRARIESAGRRVIEVRGRDRHGERVFVAFGRAPNCPLLR